MLREAILAVLMLTGVIGHPIEEDHEYDHNFVLRNITSLWEELQDLRLEINHHLHEGHEEVNHDQAVQEVETMHHEHHVHHLQHPHEGHNEHHDTELLRHLSEVHGHMDHHADGQSGQPGGHSGHGHQHGHGHSHGHHHGHQDGDEHDGEEEESQVHHKNEDYHDTHGLHSYEDEHEYGHEQQTADKKKSHRHSDDDDDDDDDDSNESPKVRPGLALIPGTEGQGGTPTHSDAWMHATCSLQPNADIPESSVAGTVLISQRKDNKGPVYFDLHLSGIDVATMGQTHGFHVHERSVTDGSCGTTGGHFNPEGLVHGAPEDDIRHVGDLGNIEVDENGELHGHIISDRKVAFVGTNSIIGKALVLHVGVDDLGKGGDAGSLSTGNAGGRLACCTIHMKAVPFFRFKG